MKMERRGLGSRRRVASRRHTGAKNNRLNGEERILCPDESASPRCIGSRFLPSFVLFFFRAQRLFR